MYLDIGDGSPVYGYFRKRARALPMPTYAVPSGGQRYSTMISPSVLTKTMPSASQSAMTMRLPIALVKENNVLPMLTTPLG